MSALPKDPLDALLERRTNLENEILQLDLRIRNTNRRIDDSGRALDVELYQGGFNVSVEFVRRHQAPIGQLQWLPNLGKRFSARGSSPGDVSGEAWGSGALLDGNVFLTSGHLFDQFGDARRRPSRKNATIPSEEIALLMEVKFNFQKDATGSVRDPHVFPVVALLEHRLGGLDYAIVELGPDDEGRMPNEVFGALRVATKDVPVGALISLIQHPNGKPKVVDTGQVIRNDGGVIAYVKVDTNGGTSGAPVLYPCDDSGPGHIVGVHQRGGFSRFSGSSMGVSIGAIRAVSKELGGTAK